MRGTRLLLIFAILGVLGAGTLIMRRAFVDNSTTPVTFWVGNTHGASIVRLETLN